MFDLDAIQTALREQRLDGWLIYDFRGSNPLARRVLDFPPDGHCTRRWFYFVPAHGEPAKLVHRIESGMLDHLPGSKHVYLKWQELEAGLGTILAPLKGEGQLAMEYVPRNANPYVSRVDAGTVELVRELGPEIVSSGDLIQLFESCWDDQQWAMHQEVSRHTVEAFRVAYDAIAEATRTGTTITETQVQDLILAHFARHHLVTDHPPIVGVGPHSGDPHYAPSKENDTPIKKGDFVLIDLWAKLDRPRAVYSDLTRTAFVGGEAPEQYTRIFEIVAAGRDAAIQRVRDAFASGETLQGWQVDRACRDVIEKAGYGEAFVHRTGHSIGEETHGNGANIDDLETRETRRVLPRSCFSVEPGIYLPEFGIRSEVDVFVDASGTVHVTGGDIQRAIDVIA